jgi:DNA-binding response OmpR family regulator
MHSDRSTASKLRPPGDPSTAAAPLVLVRRHHVVVVDDNHHHRRPLVRALRDEGHDVHYAADGPSGELRCRESNLAIDALIASADMKSMSAFDLALRARSICREVHVLLMTRLMGPEEAHRARELGYAVIEEPFSPEQLCRRLTELLGMSKPGGHSAPHDDGASGVQP